MAAAYPCGFFHILSIAKIRERKDMRLYDEIFTGEQSALPRCVLTVGGDAYFVGVKAVGDFSEEKLTLHFPKQRVEIEGEALSIGKYCDGDLSLCGKIRAVTFLFEKENGK